MKKLTFFIIPFALSSNIYASNIGIGAALKSDDTTIYIPIDATKEIRLEPFLGIHRTKIQGSGQNTQNETYENKQYGLGVFKTISTTNSTNVYVGGRISYLEGKNVSSNNNSNINIGTRSYGYSLAPVLGFEYFPIKNLSIGADIALEYTKTKTNPVAPKNNFDSSLIYFYPNKAESTSTETRATIRYYFN